MYNLQIYAQFITPESTTKTHGTATVHSSLSRQTNGVSSTSNFVNHLSLVLEYHSLIKDIPLLLLFCLKSVEPLQLLEMETFTIWNFQEDLVLISNGM
ncbi:hypothetical protein CDAR_173421 [Caerostris darwini]|uniref:Uncharacterized protein n=1 Tax=Caerostris darwini TaxID=1538125 RepID=A0AAV4SR01_9ARAC|nr:hypothetical protein CDAR_173421 [Caerostris darwini]